MRIAEVVRIVGAPPGGDQISVDAGAIPVGGILFMGREEHPGRAFSTASDAAGEIHLVLITFQEDGIDPRYLVFEPLHGLFVPRQGKAVVAYRSRFGVVSVCDEEIF